ncbi:MAG: hypothetical protein QOI60_774, partial [Actinomycetota bacterium]|nr:hypothetical protein [Actinomycetota bacterium]
MSTQAHVDIDLKWVDELISQQEAELAPK